MKAHGERTKKKYKHCACPNKSFLDNCVYEWISSPIDPPFFGGGDVGRVLDYRIMETQFKAD